MAGSSSQPLVSEKPCSYRSNCDSGLIKHRRKYHGYVTDPKRSLARRGITASSQVDPCTTASRNDLVPVPPNGVASSSNQASHSALAAHAPSPVGQPLDNNNNFVPDTRYGEVWNNNSYAFAASSIGAQNNHAYHGVVTPSFPLPNNPATVLRHYPESFYSTSNGSAHTSSAPPYNATVLTWSQASAPEAEPSHSGSAASRTTDYYSNAELPFNNRLSSHPNTLYGEASNNHLFTSAQEFTDGTSAIAVQHDHVARGVTTSPPQIHSNGPATVSRHESDSDSSYITSNDSAHTSPESLSDATTPAGSEKPSTPEEASTDSGSVVSCAAHDGSLPHASPFEAAEPPFNHNDYSGLDALFGDASNDGGYTHTLAVEPMVSNSSIVPQNNHADGNVTATLPTPPSPPVLAPYVDDASEIEIGPVLSDLDTELHEDDIFFRGTGHEGCLCPEMMIDAGVDGWNRLLDY